MYSLCGVQAFRAASKVRPRMVIINQRVLKMLLKHHHGKHHSAQTHNSENIVVVIFHTIVARFCLLERAPRILGGECVCVECASDC